MLEMPHYVAVDCPRRSNDCLLALPLHFKIKQSPISNSGRDFSQAFSITPATYAMEATISASHPMQILYL